MLSPIDLLVLGIGVTVGTGIFVLTGAVAATRAGPAVVVSFLLAGLVCALAALCYAEFASTVPVSAAWPRARTNWRVRRQLSRPPNSEIQRSW